MVDSQKKMLPKKAITSTRTVFFTILTLLTPKQWNGHITDGLKW